MHKEGFGKPMSSSNPFQVLEEVVEEQMHEEGDTTKAQETEMKEAAEVSNSGIRLDTMEEDEAKDMDLGDLDLDALEVECRKAD